jgi:hypothetical protein
VTQLCPADAARAAKRPNLHIPEPFGDLSHGRPGLNLDVDRPDLLARLSG